MFVCCCFFLQTSASSSRQPEATPQEGEAPALSRRRRERRASSEQVSVKSLLGVLPSLVFVTDVRGGTQELPLPESVLPEGWIPPPLVIEVFVWFVMSFFFVNLVLTFSLSFFRCLERLLWGL